MDKIQPTVLAKGGGGCREGRLETLIQYWRRWKLPLRVGGKKLETRVCVKVVGHPSACEKFYDASLQEPLRTHTRSEQLSDKGLNDSEYLSNSGFQTIEYSSGQGCGYSNIPSMRVKKA